MKHEFSLSGRRWGLLATAILLSVAQPQLRAQLQFSPLAARAFGQAKTQLVTGSPNLVEGRELNGPRGIAVDTTGSTPVLYVADTFNNRVLGFRNANSLQNGKAADLVIGQPDAFTTTPGGPTTSSSVGLNLPSGLAVDSSGNLFVVDTGNNRVLRYPSPIASLDRGDGVLPDRVIGQRTFSTSTTNSGTSRPTADGLSFSANGALNTAAVALDANGNLWVTDPGNNRALRYSAASIRAGNGPVADTVLGQPDFTSNTVPSTFTVDSRFDKSFLLGPTGIAVDASGRVYITDNLVRVSVYVPSGGAFTNGQAAARVIGAVRIPQGGSTAPSAFTLGITNSSGILSSTAPQGVFVNGNTVYVADTAANRVLRYDSFDTWAAETATTSGPAARQVIGQPSGNFITGVANQGQPDASALSLNYPITGAFAGNQLFLLDAQNNRVLIYPLDSSGAPQQAATAVIGQLDFPYFAPNLIEGRELFVFAGYSRAPIPNNGGQYTDGAGIVVDSTSNPPRLFIADTYNHRVLGFRDARNVKAGDKADLVIGQIDLQRSLINSPNNDPANPTERGLYLPAGLAVDSQGNLWVADSGNGRVLRFAKPFDTSDQRPNLVLGQQSTTTKITDATARTMSRPFGIAFLSDGSVLVSDAALSRVLLFQKPSGGDFRTGQAATGVVGQPDFTTSTPGSTDNRLTSPRHIATDSSDRLYVADTGNGRITIFDRSTLSGADPSPALTLGGFNFPAGLYVSKTTGEIWVANTIANSVQRYPNFNQLITQRDADTTIPVSAPIAVTLDGFGNLIVIEGTNRVSFYFPGATSVISANYTTKPLSPGVIATLYPSTSGQQFSSATAAASSVPLPTTLGDTQLLINGVAVPLFYVSPGQINFLAPMNLPTSGTADFQVIKASVGQIVGSGQFRLAPYSPALFTTNGSGQGQVAAVNADGTVNSPTNAAKRGDYITIYATGAGRIANAPADGAAATGPVPTDTKPQVLIGTAFVPADSIQYSGLAPGFPGVWQINVKIPDLTAINASVPLVVVVGGSFASNDATGLSTARLVTTIAVKDK